MSRIHDESAGEWGRRQPIASLIRSSERGGMVGKVVARKTPVTIASQTAPVTALFTIPGARTKRAPEWEPLNNHFR